jgi:arylsulfatase A-like enzyme
MKPYRLLNAVFLVLFSCVSALAADKPNVVLVVADDLGYGGLNCYGTPWLETPNIDRLSSEGMKFTLGLAAYPTCQPSRMALLSGQYGPRTGGYRVSEGHKGNEHLIKYVVPEKKSLALDKITLAECFRDAGYSTAMYGKWHVSNYSSGHPKHHGFDEAIAGTGHFSPDYHPPIQLAKGQYAEEELTNRACDFMERTDKNGKPFFLYMPYFLVHKPLEAKPEYVEHFKRKLSDVTLKDKHAEDTPVVAAMTKMLDDCVGNLLEKIKALGIEENTIVLFTSDNGAYTTDLTGPNRGQKGDTYDGGLEVPYIFKWPGKVAAGSVCDQRIIGVDVYPTLLSLAGIKQPESHPLDGMDLGPLVTGKVAKLVDRQVFCFYPKYAQFSEKKKRWAHSWRNVIYDGDFKLIEYPEYDEYELFNLREDPMEETNLAEKDPEKRRTLTRELHDWIKEVGAPPLQPNPDYSLR